VGELSTSTGRDFETKRTTLAFLDVSNHRFTTDIDFPSCGWDARHEVRGEATSSPEQRLMSVTRTRSRQYYEFGV
jgi:hypothetical protein